VIAALGGLVSAPDKEALTGPFAEYVADWMRLSAINGHYGYWDDDQAFISEWGFDLAQMEVPVRVWWADQDLMVPEAHGVWLASHVRGAVGVALSGEGHISLLSRHVDDIVAGLAGDAGDL
jgi:pimeloyl-ACP methyl ester carboxylesterase